MWLRFPSPSQLCPTPRPLDPFCSVPPLPRGPAGGQATCHLGSGYTLFEISEPNFWVLSSEGCPDHPKDLQQRGNRFCAPLVATRKRSKKEKSENGCNKKTFPGMGLDFNLYPHGEGQEVKKSSLQFHISLTNSLLGTNFSPAPVLPNSRLHDPTEEPSDPRDLGLPSDTCSPKLSYFLWLPLDPQRKEVISCFGPSVGRWWNSC